MTMLPAAAIVPTRNRPDALATTLGSLEQQSVWPEEVYVIDASDDGASRDVVNAFANRFGGRCRLAWLAAAERGAAPQRNQGVAASRQPVVWFFDDDIRFEPEAVARLWRALETDRKIGGANAMIVNQRYSPPRIVSASVFRLMHGRREASYAGRILGPAVNLLPEDRADLPEVVPVQWLNTTCTLYRREALPAPPFSSHFTGYSLMEDVCLSVTVGRTWQLVNARTARIHHDSRPGDHKSDVAALAEMELVNRHHVMTRILGRCAPSDYCRLAIWELFGISSLLRTRRGLRRVPADLRGKLRGIRRLARETREGRQ